MNESLCFVRRMAGRLGAANARGQVELHVSLEDVAKLVRLASLGARVDQRPMAKVGEGSDVGLSNEEVDAIKEASVKLGDRGVSNG